MGIENEKKLSKREDEQERRRKLGEEIQVLLDKIEHYMGYSDTACSVEELEGVKRHLEHASEYLP